MTGERVVLYCVGGPAQRTETWVDLPGLPSTQRPPLLAVHCHHQGVILFSVRGRMHGRRQQAACTQHWHRPGGTREDEAKAERECRASCSRDDAAWNVAQRPTPKLGVRRAVSPGTSNRRCSAVLHISSVPSQQEEPYSLFFGGCRTSLVLDRGSMVPRLIASRRGGPPEISVAPGAMGGPGQRGGRPRLALKIGLLELPTACSAGLCQSRRRQDFPSSHAAVAGRRCTVDERRRLDDAVTAMLETWHTRECEVKICRHGSDVESLLSVSAGVSRIAFRTSSVGGLCVLDVER